MKAYITVAPAEFSGNSVTIAFPYKAYFAGPVEVKNKADLVAKVAEIKAGINADAQIFVKALSRKFAGFDEFYRVSGRSEFYIYKKQEAA